MESGKTAKKSKTRGIAKGGPPGEMELHFVDIDWS